MNKLLLIAYLLITLLLSVMINFGFMYLGARSTHSAMVSEGDRSAEALLQTVTQLNRKDLLTGNIRGVRLSLQGLIDRGVISGYRIQSADLRDESDLFAVRSNSVNSRVFSSEIYFSNQGQEWGRVEYLLPRQTLLAAAQGFSRSFLLLSVLALFFTMAPIATSYLLAVRSTGLLPDTLMKIADSGEIPGSVESFQNRLWLPTLTRFTALTSQLREAKRAEVFATIAAQVSHDIRSPLASLNAVVHSSQGLDEGTRVQIRTAVNRIRDIANGLLEKNREQVKEASAPLPVSATSAEPKFVELLSAQIESAVSQKRLQFQSRSEIIIDFKLESEAFGIFAEVQVTELHRCLSNLINNAVEAIDGAGRVDVCLSSREGDAVLTVSDSGKGIPPELLQKVLERGGTFGKKDGNGLGLSHAKATVESWGGKVRLESTFGKGTSVIIEMPLSEPQGWFAGTLVLNKPATVIVLDDDPGIHGLWKKRFEAFAPAIAILGFDSSDSIIAWFRKSLGVVDNPLYLMDYELAGSKQTGLDVIEMLGIAAEAVLVTSRYDEPELRKRCERSRVKLLPKTMAASVPIQNVDQQVQKT